MSRRPAALLVTPILPATGGNGLAMRAGVWLEGLAADHEVTLLVVPVAGAFGGGAGAGAGIEAGALVGEQARRWAVLDLRAALDPLFALSSAAQDPAARLAALCAYPRPQMCRWATTPALAGAVAAVAATAGGAGKPGKADSDDNGENGENGENDDNGDGLDAGARPGAAAAMDGWFDTVVVMRSYLAPYAAPFLGQAGEAGGPGGGGAVRRPRRPRRVLDLDDDERLTQRRLSDLLALRGQAGAARMAAAEAAKYAAHEAAWLPRFDLLVAASELHAAAVRRRHPASEVAVVPNVVTVPRNAPRRRQRAAGEPLRLLFVGNLSYEPNVDAALWLAQEIAPLLAVQGVPVALRLAGARPAPPLAALAVTSAGPAGFAGSATAGGVGAAAAGGAAVEVVADPEDLVPLYAEADAAVVPIRAGGGTRIKILEAFAAGVPVVASRLGAEGLAVEDGVHLLLADDTAGLAAACRRLGADAPLAARLSESALRLVRRRYSRPLGLAAIRALAAHN